MSSDLHHPQDSLAARFSAYKTSDIHGLFLLSSTGLFGTGEDWEFCVKRNLSRTLLTMEPFDALREIVLGRVDTLVKTFVRTISLQRGLSEAAANAAGGKIFTFGSYRLGVHGPGTDIDTLCVVPKHVSREDFFDTFEPMLKEVEGVTEVAVRIRARCTDYT